MAVDPARLIGTWKLVSYVIEHRDGRLDATVMGDKPYGRLIYTADGNMLAHIAAPGRANFAKPFLMGATPDEAKAATDSYLAYGGAWRIDGDLVIHTVEGSLFPNWVGGEQVRTVGWDGDRLVLSTPAMERAQGRVVARLTWRR